MWGPSWQHCDVSGTVLRWYDALSYWRNSSKKGQAVDAERLILSEMFRYAMSLKWCSVGIKGADVNQKSCTTGSSLHTGWSHWFMQFMLNCHPAVTVLQHKPWSLRTSQSFLLCSGDDIPSMASSHSFWADGVERGMGFCCCGPSILTFDYLSDLRCPPAHHHDTELLLWFLWAIRQLEQSLSFYCDLS